MDRSEGGPGTPELVFTTAILFSSINCSYMSNTVQVSDLSQCRQILTSACTPAASYHHTIFRLAVRLTSIAAAGRIQGTADLKVLHAVKQSQQLSLVLVAIQARTLQDKQQLVRCFESREAADLRLLLDYKAARSSSVEHHSR